MKKSNYIIGILSLSLALNLIFFYDHLKDDKNVVGQHEITVRQTGIQSVDYHSLEEKENVLIHFKTAMDTSTLPVHIFPFVKAEHKWHSNKKLELTFKERIIPGKKYFFKTTKDLKDRDGRLLQSKFSEFFAGGLAVVKTDVVNCGGDHAEVILQLNGVVTEKNLKKNLVFTGNNKELKPYSVSKIDKRTFRLNVKVHTEETLQLCLKGTLTADQAEKSLGQDYITTIKLDKELLLNFVEARQYNEGIRIKLEFNRDLSLEALEKHLSVEPKTEFQIERSPYSYRYYLMGNFKPAQQYQVNLKKGLKSPDGSVLEKDVSKTVITGHLRSSVSFLSKGPFFPAGRDFKVPIKVIGTEKIDLEVRRIYPNNIVQFLLKNNDRSKRLGKSIFKKTIVTGVGLNEIKKLDLKLDDFLKEKTGVYTLSLSKSGNSWNRQTRVLIRTSLGMSLAKTSSAIQLWTFNLNDGKPEENVEAVLLSYQNQELARINSDKQGLVEFDLEKLNEKPFMVKLIKGGDIAYRGLENHINLSAFKMPAKTYNQQEYEAYIFAERGTCRPGEEMDFSIILRDKKKRAVGGFPLELLVSGPGNTELVKETLTVPSSGFFSKKISITKNSKTGYYRFKLRIPGEKTNLGEHTFLVNTYTPDTFTVKLPKPIKIISGNKIPVSLSSVYNFGGPLSKAEVILDYSYISAPFSHKNYKEYTFGDPSRQINKYDRLRSKLDDKGQGDFQINIEDLKSAQSKSTQPSALGRLVVNASVTDSNGQTVSRRENYLHMPYPYLIGLSHQESGKKRKINWVRVNAEGEEVTSADIMEWEVIHKKWHFSYKENSEGRYVWSWRCEKKSVQKGTMTQSAGHGQIELAPREQGNYELVVTSQEGHVRTVLPYNIGQNSNNVRLGNSEFIKLHSDEEVYTKGQLAQIRFNSPAAGIALVRVVGTKLHGQQIQQVQRGWNNITIKIPQTDEGSIYAAVTLVRHLDQKLSLPPRFFGLLNLRVDQQHRQLQVEMTAPQKVEPGETVKVRLKISGKSPRGRIKVMAVDSGILSLTAYKTPSPYDYFFKERALNAKFMDMFDDMFPEINENFSSIALVGGGGGSEAAFRGNGFGIIKSHVVTFGIVEVDETGHANLEFKAPAFNGSLRLMAIAVNDDALGQTEAKLIVQDKVTVMSGLVKSLTPGDQLNLPISLFNNLDRQVKGKLFISLTGPASLGSPTMQELTLAPGKTLDTALQLTALSQSGRVTLTMTYKADGVHSTKKLEFMVRPAYARVTTGMSGKVSAKTSKFLDLTDKWQPGTVKSSLLVTTSSAAEMFTYFQQLQKYPYGCLEQTTSKAIVNLYASQLAPEDQRDKSSTIVEAALKRLNLMQTNSGGFSMWPSGNKPWLSSSVYAGHFMMECRDRGFKIDSYRLTKFKRFLSRLIEDQFDSNIQDRAYALYILAGLGKVQKQMALSIAESTKNSVLARILACGALERSGLHKEAMAIFAKLDLEKLTTENISWDMDTPQRRLSLAALVSFDIFGMKGKSQYLCDSLIQSLRKKHWLSTQDKALLCMTAGQKALLQKENLNSEATITVNGQSHRVANGKQYYFNSLGVPQNPLIQSHDKGPVFYSFFASGIPLNGGKEESKGLAIERLYLNADNETVTTLTPGQQIAVQLTIKAAVDLDNTVILDLLPGCLAVESAYLKTRNGSFDVSHGQVKHYEGLDDRMVICMDLKAGVEVEISYTARVIAAGQFNLCGLSAEGMYKPEIRASKNYLGKLTVVKNIK
jgi:alpha-2-macroglobulin